MQANILSERRQFGELVANYSTIGIIGLDKNVGKTTVLHFSIKLFGSVRLGLTSIGRDGEDKDLVYNTDKPKIYVSKGTLIATAKKSLLSGCDTSLKVHGVTPYYTPLGAIVIAEAMSDGFVELSGPSYNEPLEVVCKELHKYGAEKIMIDGALNRIGALASGQIDGGILVTGAAFNRQMSKVIQETKKVKGLLTLPLPDETIQNKYRSLTKNHKVIWMDSRGNYRTIPTDTTLGAHQFILNHRQVDDRYLLIKGTLTDALLRELIISMKKDQVMTIVIEDGTKAFISNETYTLYKKSRVELRSMNPISIIAVAYNPYSPYGYCFDEQEFYKGLKQYIECPIINVLGGNGHASI